MKIAHVCPFYEPAIGGVKQVVAELAKRQIAAGHEVHIFTSDWDKKQRIKILEETIDGVKVHRLKHWCRASNFMTFWPGVFSKIFKGQFDVVHTHLFAHPHFVLAGLAARLSSAKHIHTTHCPWSDAPRSLIGRLGILVSYNFFSRAILKITNKVIAITPWENKFIQKYGGSTHQIVNLPNGMDEIFFKKITNNNFKKKHKINGKMVLFFGRFNVTKGPERFVNIAKILSKQRKDLTFVMVGPDEGLMEKVKNQSKKEKSIKILGPIRDRLEVIKMYQSAEVYVMPSYREGLPLTLFEAMASGCPIVASPVNGIPYEINNENGFLVNYGDDKEFANKIEKILNNKKLANKISKTNKEKAKNYDWDKIFEKTMKVYKDD